MVHGSLWEILDHLQVKSYCVDFDGATTTEEANTGRCFVLLSAKKVDIVAFSINIKLSNFCHSLTFGCITFLVKLG